MKKKRKKHIKALDVALIVVAAFFVAFTAIMVVTFWRFQMIPDTLVASFYTSCGIELIMAAWIETKKQKRKETKHDDSEIYNSEHYL